MSRATATDDRTKRELQNHARWLISVLFWIPDDQGAITFVETFGVTERLFEVAHAAMLQESNEVLKITQELLLSWAFKAGHHDIDYTILEQSICALATLALWKDDAAEVAWLKAELAERLNNEKAPNQEMRDDAARKLRVCQKSVLASMRRTII
jgi:hypothetical protein